MGEELHSFGDAFCVGAWNVDAVTSVVARGRSEVPSIDTVGDPVATVVGCLIASR